MPDDTPAPLQDFQAKVAFETPWFQVIEQHLKDARGQGHLYYHLKSSDGVLVIPFTKNKEVVLVRQYRPAISSWSIEFPAGGIENKETPLEAAKRELGEETGFQSKEWHSLGTGYTSMDRISNRLHGFLASECEFTSGLRHNEEIETIVIPLDELKKKVVNGEYQQLGGIGLLLKAEWMIGKILG